MKPSKCPAKKERRSQWRPYARQRSQQKKKFPFRSRSHGGLPRKLDFQPEETDFKDFQFSGGKDHTSTKKIKALQKTRRQEAVFGPMPEKEPTGTDVPQSEADKLEYEEGQRLDPLWSEETTRPTLERVSREEETSFGPAKKEKRNLWRPYAPQTSGEDHYDALYSEPPQNEELPEDIDAYIKQQESLGVDLDKPIPASEDHASVLQGPEGVDLPPVQLTQAPPPLERIDPMTEEKVETIPEPQMPPPRNTGAFDRTNGHLKRFGTTRIDTTRTRNNSCIRTGRTEGRNCDTHRNS